mgnify:CR=1 FL=1
MPIFAVLFKKGCIFLDKELPFIDNKGIDS